MNLTVQTVRISDVPKVEPISIYLDTVSRGQV